MPATPNLDPPGDDVREAADERSSFFDAAAQFTEYLCAQVGDARFLVRTEDKHIGRSLYVKQGRGDIKVLHRCVGTVEALTGKSSIRGRTFVDVGANIGSTTVHALLAYAFGDAVAIEPEPHNFVTLRLNLLLNGLEERVKALQVAASNTVGELSLVVIPSRSGKHWIATDPKRLGKGETTITVPTVTLDSLAAEGVFDPDRVGLAWLDAENHEGQILEGASEVVARGVPLVFEWDPTGLEERGDRGKIGEIVGEHYTHFADMRGSSDPEEAKYSLRPAEELGDYTHLVAPGEEHFTEILVLRLSRRQVPRAGLGMVLRRRTLARRQKAQKKAETRDKRRPAEQAAGGDG